MPFLTKSLSLKFDIQQAMRDNLNSYQTLASLVRTFFEGFTNGVADAHGIDISDRKQIKQIMLNHYENISKSYAEVMFPILSVVNYDSLEEVEAKTQGLKAEEAANIEHVFRIACNDSSLYEAMVEEYKRNFGLLLQGRFSGVQEHIDDYIKGENKELRTATNEEKTLRLLVRTTVQAYVSGMKMAKADCLSIKQASIISMLITNANILINNAPIDQERTKEIKDIYEYFLIACGTPEHCHVIFSELEIQLKYITATEHLIPANEQAN